MKYKVLKSINSGEYDAGDTIDIADKKAAKKLLDKGVIAVKTILKSKAKEDSE
ncbi:unnamed protein product [marine sediment metagenome]|uniref:Uncharacterized protein n=1 Tax=marine sediment metagenome TaxID=412755 RepID=X0TP15_9ZZZZ